MKLLKHALSTIKSILPFLSIISVIAVAYVLTQNSAKLNTEVNELKSKQTNLEQNLPDELFSDHLKVIEKQTLELKVQTLENEITTLKSNDKTAELIKIQDLLTKYQEFKTKLTRNDTVKIDTKESQSKIDEWGTKLLNKEYEVLSTEITEQITKLDTAHKNYLATLPPPPSSIQGYSYTTVRTEKGTQHGVWLIKVPLNSVRVKTVAAISSDCSRDCATKNLAEYVKEQGGFAGMAGSYACPADYADCANKKWSFDFALYDSDDRKWLNKDALSWGKTGMMSFKGTSARMHKKTTDYDGDSVDAAVSNFPSLLDDGDVVWDQGDYTSYQKVKALRGAIGFGGENLYLAYISSASVEDAAYVMKALGAQNALNLDGGGTAAMYINGGYVVGPGRPLANAVILVK